MMNLKKKKGKVRESVIIQRKHHRRRQNYDLSDGLLVKNFETSNKIVRNHRWRQEYDWPDGIFWRGINTQGSWLALEIRHTSTTKTRVIFCNSQRSGPCSVSGLHWWGFFLFNINSEKLPKAKLWLVHQASGIWSETLLAMLGDQARVCFCSSSLCVLHCGNLGRWFKRVSMKCNINTH